MIVPLIEVKVDKGKKETSLAEIALVSLTSKITNLITTLDFVQTEPVSDVVKETSYRVYFISENNEKISNENIVIADKKDKDTTKRMFRLRFNFKNKKYDKSQKYYLVAYDDKYDMEIIRHEIIMDIAFADDFGFSKNLPKEAKIMGFSDALAFAVVMTLRDMNKEKEKRLIKTQIFYQECYERITEDSKQVFDIVSNVVQKGGWQIHPCRNWDRKHIPCALCVCTGHRETRTSYERAE